MGKRDEVHFCNQRRMGVSTFYCGRLVNQLGQRRVADNATFCMAALSLSLSLMTISRNKNKMWLIASMTLLVVDH